jgi:hypothetical protein
MLGRFIHLTVNRGLSVKFGARSVKRQSHWPETMTLPIVIRAVRSHNEPERR